MGFYTVLLVIHSIIVLFLIMMVLIQRTDSDGMGGLGGGGGNQFLSGRTTANLMTRTTAILAGAFMISSLTLAVLAGRMTSGSIVDSVPTTTETVPATDAAKDGSKSDTTLQVSPDKPAPDKPAKKAKAKAPKKEEPAADATESPTVPRPE